MPRKQSPPSFEYVLLGLLKQKPMHGYELCRAAGQIEGVSLVWRINQSALYALLERMEEMDWIAGRVVPGESRPARKEYALTDSGCRQFLDWVQQPVEHGRDIRQVFVAKLYFAEREGWPVAQRLVEAQRLRCQAWLEAFRTQVAQATPEQGFDALVLDYRVQQMEGILSWLDRCRQRLAG
ncbi:MAG TPA: PadR family transcriptional regulator [Anaerolineaceae bacterium]|nr:PadR family transcriptional regulator [Anaerolineaceae bacterium]